MIGFGISDQIRPDPLSLEKLTIFFKFRGQRFDQIDLEFDLRILGTELKRKEGLAEIFTVVDLSLQEAKFSLVFGLF